MLFCADDWKCDQYRWINDGVAKLPKKDPVVKKTYFLCDTPTGPSTEFKRHAYELIPANNYVLVHYLGNENIAIAFPHGNSKQNTRKAYVRTCPSVMEKMKTECNLSTAKKVYHKNIMTDHLPSYQSVFQPRNYQQVENLRNQYLQQKRISHDSLFNVHELAIDLPEFVHKIETYPDLLCICAYVEICEEFDRVLTLESELPQLISYDTTFQLGDFYVSILCFRHTLFKECPVIPAAFLIHERKFKECHEKFFMECAKHVPTLQKVVKPIVTDDEKGIVESIKKVFPNLKWLRCWNHIFQDVRRWLRSNTDAPADNIDVYIANLRRLFHRPLQEQYNTELEEMAKKWSASFFEYYYKNIHVEIESIARWSLEPVGLYDGFSGVTNNQSESLNNVIKNLQDWREMSLDCVLLAFYYLQGYYLTEIFRGQNGLGIYNVLPRYTNSIVSVPQPQSKLYPPEEIVSRIKGKFNDSDSKISINQPSEISLSNPLSQEARARKLIEDCKIAHNAQLQVFTVVSSNGSYVVRLYPEESCTCPSKKDCYHIIAAKMSIDIKVESGQPKHINLTQLRRNSRGKKAKKSGRKRPREGDYEVTAAPDAVKSEDLHLKLAAKKGKVFLLNTHVLYF